MEDESQINLWYLKFKSFISDKTREIKNLFLGETAKDANSINQVKPKMNTIIVVNEFMNGSYLG